MGVLVRNIPFVELLLILSIFGLGGVGYFSLVRKPKDQVRPAARTIGIWILAGLVCLALLAIILFLVASLGKG